MMRTPRVFALSILLPGSAAGQDVIGLLAHAAGHVAAAALQFCPSLPRASLRAACRSGQRFFQKAANSAAFFWPKFFHSWARSQAASSGAEFSCRLQIRKNRERFRRRPGPTFSDDARVFLSFAFRRLGETGLNSVAPRFLLRSFFFLCRDNLQHACSSCRLRHILDVSCETGRAGSRWFLPTSGMASAKSQRESGTVLARSIA